VTARLATLIEGIEGRELVGEANTLVSGVTQDSRAVTDGSLYCCIVGRKVDGHDLAGDVVRAGAGSLLVERWVDAPVPQVRVPSTRSAVGPVAAAFYGHPSHALSVIGVTGTNGKTTTTHLIADVLAAAGRQSGLIGTLSGTLSGYMTTPEAAVLQGMLARFLDEGCEAVAMEVSSIALDQHRVDGVAFQVGVWTNLTQDHLDYHGGMEAYFAAKARLFEPGRCELAVVNTDDAWGRRLLDQIHIPAVTYGLDDATQIETSAEGTRFVWHGEHIRIGLAGKHNVANALAAATSCAQLGVPTGLIASGLAGARPIPGRWERVDAGQDFAVIVDYAHTPDGLEQLLEAARAAAGPAHRVLVVFGAGGDRDRAKRPQMGELATRLADVAVLTSDNPRSEDPLVIIDEVAAGAAPSVVIRPDRAEAIAEAIGRAVTGDVVVIAGKGHETGQQIGDRVLPFDDRDVARAALNGS
jgi:UDP-N-acetylmuramoyl-L-alanyl-D-glutamate--2,6-diaminopimelate ligase